MSTDNAHPDKATVPACVVGDDGEHKGGPLAPVVAARASPLQRDQCEKRIRAITTWSSLLPHRKALLGAIADILFRGHAAAKRLQLLLRAARVEKDADARNALSETLFGVALWRRRLAWHLTVDLSRLDAADATLPAAFLFSFLHHLAALDSAKACELCGLKEPPAARNESPHIGNVALADCYSLPDWLAQTIDHEFGNQAAAFCEALNSPGPVCLRANTLTVDREALAAELTRRGVACRPTQLAPQGLVLDGRANIYGLMSELPGWFDVQDEGSQLLGELVAAQPGERVVDYCAGAGGKTLLLGMAMHNTGELLVHDIDLDRLDRLAVRAKQTGLTCVKPLRNVPDSAHPLLADRVLVDAPCSSVGPLRRGPDMRWLLQPATFAAIPALQYDILCAASLHVRPGGRLVYATCSFRTEENDDVALKFERAHPDFVRLTPSLALSAPVGMNESKEKASAKSDSANWPSSLPVPLRHGFFLCVPHLHNTDGFFAAVWQRQPSSPSAAPAAENVALSEK